MTQNQLCLKIALKVYTIILFSRSDDATILGPRHQIFSHSTTQEATKNPHISPMVTHIRPTLKLKNFEDEIMLFSPLQNT